VARQTATTLAGEMLYLTNRFQVTAFNVKTGNQHWSQPLGKEQAPAHGWNLMPSRPVVAGDRLFVRRLAKANPELACLNTANGNQRWATRNTVNVASDPILLQDRLYVFTAAATHENGMLMLDFSLVDPATGEVALQQPVIQLRNLWDRQFGCQAAVVGSRIIAVCGGTVVCCDVTGRPLWVRRQLWIPSSQALAANEQSPALPIVVGKRLFVMLPGVFTLECLDLETGRRIWQQPIPDWRRLLGTSGQRLIVETARGWQAHAMATGLPLWQHDAEQVLDAQVCPASGELLVAQRDQLPGDQWKPVLVWLDPESGRETARWPLDALPDKQPMLGPVIVDNDRLWLLFGRGIREPHRDLYELTPTADPAHPPKVAARQ